MLTITHRCEGCGRRVPADQSCASCAPSPTAIATVLSRAVALWIVVVAVAAILIDLV